MIDQLLIGGFTYSVSNPAELPDEDRPDEKLDGDVDYQNMVIAVAKANPQMEAATLLHEIVHTILEHANVRHSERIAHVLGYGLAQLIAENPAMVEFVQKAWQKQPDLKVVKNTA